MSRTWAIRKSAKGLTLKGKEKLPSATAMRRREAAEGPKGNEKAESAAYQRKEDRLGIERHKH